MHCLTDAEFSNWLSDLGMKLSKDDNLEFCKPKGSRFRLLAYVPKGAVELRTFASWLATWLPKGYDRVLWLKRWMTYPPDNTVLFERLRQGCGEPRPLGEAPGHLFGPPSQLNFDERTPVEIEDGVVLAAMIHLVIQFDWDAYLLAEGSDNYIYISDGCASFSSSDQGELNELSGQLSDLSCTVSWIKAE